MISYCLNESGVLLAFDPGSWTGDKGYAGNNMITPVKKPANRDLLDWEKEFNTQVNKIRYVIERTIANFKTWRIMHTDYRRPLATFTNNHLSCNSPALLCSQLNNPQSSCPRPSVTWEDAGC